MMFKANIGKSQAELYPGTGAELYLYPGTGAEFYLYPDS